MINLSFDFFSSLQLLLLLLPLLRLLSRCWLLLLESYFLKPALDDDIKLTCELCLLDLFEEGLFLDWSDISAGEDTFLLSSISMKFSPV